MSVKNADKSKPYMPLASLTQDGYSNEDEATATCFCGAVQLAFPVNKPGYKGAFVCNCYDCHKISSSMFCSNFIVDNKYLKHLRGKENLKEFSQKKTPVTSKYMTNHFCSTCGTLMYRVGERFPGVSILRIGTVDDLNLMETKLRPDTELFTKDRANWLSEIQGVEHVEGMGFGA